MIDKHEFTKHVNSAYDNLYDLVHLRTHPLGMILLSDPQLSRKERAWQLHHLLLHVLDDLNAGNQTPVFSHEWRRHRLMILRHVDGLDAQTVADELSISRRHFYREHTAAIEAIATILWQRHVEEKTTEEQQVEEEPIAGEQQLGDSLKNHVAQEDSSRLELLRRETISINPDAEPARLLDVVQGLLPLLQDIAAQKQVTLDSRIHEHLPAVAVEQGLLRQMLLGMLGYLIEYSIGARIEVSAQLVADGALLSSETKNLCELHLKVVSRSNVQLCGRTKQQDRLAAFHELAALTGITVTPLYAWTCQKREAEQQEPAQGFVLRLPPRPNTKLLVVDDNEDTLALFQRYLSGRYTVSTAQTAYEALAIARSIYPTVMIIDLMMPDQDGWDLLQTLRHQPDLQAISVVVCSVLQQRELALALGADQFLQKPFSEQSLFNTLAKLQTV